MNIKVIGEEEQVIEPKEAETITLKLDEFLPQSVGQLFDLSPDEINHYSDKLGTLIDYAKTCTDDRSPEGIKWAIRSLESRVGTPPLGEKRINFLSKYAWLKLDELRLKKEVEQYEHNHE